MLGIHWEIDSIRSLNLWITAMRRFFGALTLTSHAFLAGEARPPPKSEVASALVLPSLRPGALVTTTEMDPLNPVVIARMAERLLLRDSPERALSAVPLGIDREAVERLSKERLASEFQRDVESVLLAAPIIGTEETTEKLEEMLRTADPIVFEPPILAKLRGDLTSALKDGDNATALKALHETMSGAYPLGFMQPPAKEVTWGAASRLFSELVKLPPSTPRDLLNEKAIELLGYLEEIFPGRYLGEARFKMLQPDLAARLKHCAEEAKFFSYQYARAYGQIPGSK